MSKLPLKGHNLTGILTENNSELHVVFNTNQQKVPLGPDGISRTEKSRGG